MRESKLEKMLKTNIEQLGGLCLKWISPGTKGVPDRIVLLDNFVAFVEMKNETGKLSRSQEYMIKQLRGLSLNVYVLSTEDEVNDFIQHMKEGNSYIDKI